MTTSLPSTPPPSIRILPMTPEEEFATEQEVRDYFLVDLPGRRPPGRYNFRTSGLLAARGSLILCQYRSAIRAQSTLLRRVDQTSTFAGIQYKGYLELNVRTIRYFNRPITEEEVSAIWPGVRFSQAKHDLPVAGFTRWDNLVNAVGFQVP